MYFSASSDRRSRWYWSWSPCSSACRHVSGRRYARHGDDQEWALPWSPSWSSTKSRLSKSSAAAADAANEALVDATFESGIKADVAIAACPDVTTGPCFRALRIHPIFLEKRGGREWSRDFLTGQMRVLTKVSVTEERKAGIICRIK